MKKYCLIGERLSHSYSAEIHKEFGYLYELRELKADGIKAFVDKKEYDGFNVTIPYKKEIMKFLDVVDPIALEIGAVNTVVYKDGKAFGCNTDILGMEYVFNSKGITLEGKKVLILGSGGTSKTAQALAKLKKAREIIIIGRSSEDNYDNLYKHSDAEVIINTTPVGMYPNNGEKIIELDNFSSLESVFDAIYNPLLTPFLLDAKKRGLKFASGLKMLVAQAKYASDIFKGEKADCSEIERIYNKLYFNTVNIILIGMPSSGKTTIGKELSLSLGKKFIDTDEEIEKAFGKIVSKIFEENGERAFREKESEALKTFGKEKGQVISVGGGAVKGDNAYAFLKQNGIIVYLKRDFEKAETKGRPLLQKDAQNILKKLYEERLPLYSSFADITADNNGKIEDTVKYIKEKIYESIGD